jgi:HAD superfamily hydrolase (TIGR01484 family)
VIRELVAQRDREVIGMRYRVLACDYDGTLAHDGAVSAPTIAALDRLRRSERFLFMVTGRELSDLQNVCPVLDKFEWVVAENGALLYRPANNFSKLLCAPASPELAQKLAEAGVEPLSMGRAIIATREPHQVLAVELIKQLGLELKVIFNKGAVMILPSGVNKATGLSAALQRMKIAPEHVIGIGDAENDHAFLELCRVAVAVANALPLLKEHADLITRGARGQGVIELIDRIITTDLADVIPHARAAAISSGGEG